MHAIGRNLFNLVAAVDVASPEGLGLAVALVDLLDERYPIRAGILPVLPAATGDIPHFVSGTDSCQHLPVST